MTGNAECIDSRKGVTFAVGAAVLFGASPPLAKELNDKGINAIVADLAKILPE